MFLIALCRLQITFVSVMSCDTIEAFPIQGCVPFLAGEWVGKAVTCTRDDSGGAAVDFNAHLAALFSHLSPLRPFPPPKVCRDPGLLRRTLRRNTYLCPSQRHMARVLPLNAYSGLWDPTLSSGMSEINFRVKRIPEQVGR